MYGDGNVDYSSCVCDFVLRACDLRLLAIDADGLLRFDVGTLAILERLNYVAGLLETGQTLPQPQQHQQIPQHASPDTSLTFSATTNTIRTPQDLISNEDFYALGNPGEDNTIGYESLELEMLNNHHSSSQEIIEWPIFEGAFSRRDIDVALYNPRLQLQHHEHAAGCNDDDDASALEAAVRKNGPGRGVREDHCPKLVQLFLAQVHTKNPVLDAKHILLLSKQIAEEGFGWDAKSCLLVCVLLIQFTLSLLQD